MKFSHIFICYIISLVLLIFAPNFCSSHSNIGANMSGESSLSFAGGQGSIRFVGYASPGAVVYFMKNGQVIGSSLASLDSAFDKTLSGLEPGIHTISLYATDVDLINTVSTDYSISVSSGLVTIVSGIILPPSFSLTTDRVKRPASLIVRGHAKSLASVQLFISGSRDSRSISATTDGNGLWLANVNPKLHLGAKVFYGVSLDGYGGQSNASYQLQYTVIRSADLNNDGVVDLTDFSILMYSFKKSPIPNVVTDINDDSLTDLVDFSIMMSNWTR